MASAIAAKRLQKELGALLRAPPPGVAAWTTGDSLRSLEATLDGPHGTPYEHGVFRLTVSFPEGCARWLSPPLSPLKHHILR